jgi:hypothetical protein
MTARAGRRKRKVRVLPNWRCNMLKATVSGSFHRHMPAIYGAVGDLRAAGVNVLSPL